MVSIYLSASDCGSTTTSRGMYWWRTKQALKQMHIKTNLTNINCLNEALSTYIYPDPPTQLTCPSIPFPLFNYNYYPLHWTPASYHSHIGNDQARYAREQERYLMSQRHTITPIGIGSIWEAIRTCRLHPVRSLYPDSLLICPNGTKGCWRECACMRPLCHFPWE